MAYRITLPRVSANTNRVTLAEWNAKAGDRVEEGSVVLTIEADGIRQNIEAEASGFLHISVEAQNEVPIGTVAGIIAETKEELRGLEERKAAATPAEAASDVDQGRRLKFTIPLTGTRKAIAEHMLRSLSVSAQLTYMGEFDASELIKLRESLIAQEEALGIRVTYTDLMVAAVAKILREYPLFNASLIDDEIRVWQDINIGVAVNVENGLIVPVVRNADQKSLPELSQAVRTLMTKARERKLTLEDIQGGTFTISNFGALGGGYQFRTIPYYQPWVQQVFKEKSTKKVSIQGLECLAIIAYKQPVSRPDIDAIRGVNSEGVISTLLERDLISVQGRSNAPGRPLLYSVTQEFLRYFGLNSTSDLPRLKELKEILQAHSENYAYREDVPEEMINIPKEKNGDDGEKTASDS